jgi:putative acetyltransferase
MPRASDMLRRLFPFLLFHVVALIHASSDCLPLSTLPASERLVQLAQSRGITVRKIEKKDSAALAEFILRSRRALGIADQSTSDPYDVSDIESASQVYSSGNGAFIILEAGKAIVGSGAITKISAEKGIIKKFYLGESLRGKGLGQALLEKLLAEAHLMGLTSVELETRPVMADAIKLYERNGFSILKREPGPNGKITYGLALPLNM